MEINLKDFFKFLHKNYIVLSVSFFFVFFSFFVMALHFNKAYEAHMVIAPSDQEQGRGSVLNRVNIFSEQVDEVSELFEILSTPQFAKKMMDEYEIHKYLFGDGIVEKEGKIYKKKGFLSRVKVAFNLSDENDFILNEWDVLGSIGSIFSFVKDDKYFYHLKLRTTNSKFSVFLLKAIYEGLNASFCEKEIEAINKKVHYLSEKNNEQTSMVFRQELIDKIIRLKFRLFLLASGDSGLAKVVVPPYAVNSPVAPKSFKLILITLIKSFVFVIFCAFVFFGWKNARKNKKN